MNDIVSSIYLVSLLPSLLFAVYLILMPVVKRYTNAKWQFGILKSIMLLFVIPIYEIVTGLASGLGGYFHVLLPDAHVKIPSVSGMQTVTQWTIDAGAIAEKANSINIDLFDILTAVWLVGIVAILIYQVNCYRDFFKKIKTSIPATQIQPILSAQKEKLNITQDVAVFYNRFADTPMLIGIAKPKILLPPHGVEDCHLTYILAHELTHLKRKDLWWKFILQGICAVYWLNPIVYLLRREFETQLEHSCDELVAKSLSFQERKSYGCAILQSVRVAKKDRYSFIGVGFSTPKQKIERRIINMLNLKDTKKLPKILSATVVLLLIAVISIPAFITGADEGGASVSTALPVPKIPVSDPVPPADSSVPPVDNAVPVVNNSTELLPEDDIWAVLSLKESETTTPVLGDITSYFAGQYDPVTGTLSSHAGVDISGDEGSPIVAFADGVIRSAGYDRQYGNYISIDHGDGITTIYAHCYQLDAVEGQEVDMGEKIAEVGTTGDSTGPHLHFEMMVDGARINPLVYIDSNPV